MKNKKYWLIQDDFKVGDRVIYSINSKNLNDIFDNEKFSLKPLCEELSMSLPTLKKYLSKPELFKEKQVDKLCELLCLSEKELKNYFNSKVGSKIRGFKGLKVGQEYTVSDVTENGNKVLIKESLNNLSSNKTTPFYNHWRFDGVKIRKKFGEKHFGYIIKNEIRDEREQFWKRKEEEEKRQQLNHNKNIIPPNEFNIQKMYQWRGWFYSIKSFFYISLFLMVLVSLLYFILFNYIFHSHIRFDFTTFIISFGTVIPPLVFYKNIYGEVIEQFIIYRCINNKSRYRCSESKHLILLETKKNSTISHHKFKITKNGFHKFISLKHKVDNINYHRLYFTLTDSLDCDSSSSKTPTFEETVIVYLDYLDWYNDVGKHQVKYYD